MLASAVSSRHKNPPMSRIATTFTDSRARGSQPISAPPFSAPLFSAPPSRRRSSSLWAVLWLCFLGVFNSVGALATTPFSVVGTKVFTVAADDEAVVRSRPIEIHWPEFESWIDKASQPQASRDLDTTDGPSLGRLHLPLFDRTLDLEIESIFKSRYGWALVASDDPSAEAPNSQAILVWGSGHLHGTIRASANGQADASSYRIRSTPRGPVIEEVDLDRYPRGNDVRRVPISEAFESIDPSGSRDPTAKDSGAEIDLLVIYTPSAAATTGSPEAIQQLIELGVVETNMALLSSRVQTRLRLVATAGVDYQEGDVEIGTHLDRLTDPDDGLLDEAHSLRDFHNADLVTLVGTGTRGGCGIAWLMEGSDNTAFEAFAFNFVATPCISPNYTFGHEIGHNLGCRHAPDDPSTGEGAFDYSSGYKDPNRAFRTMMAYNCDGGCPRVLRWSNPELTYDGAPQGTAEQDNARSINNVRTVAANFRRARTQAGGRLSWTQATAEVDESDGVVSLSVKREGRTADEVQVTWEVFPQSAEAGLDMPAASGILTWRANQDGERPVEIPIFDDDLEEGDEVFVVTLRDPSDSAELGETVSVAVTIRDNDVEPFECRTDAQRLCLGSTDMSDGSGPRAGDGRFEIVATWRDFRGGEGSARIVDGQQAQSKALDSGLLWFFSPENWELLVKVLDGCAINGHFWVLFGAGTDVQIELRVTDTILGRYRSYSNPLGTAAASLIDTEAFAGCP